MFLCKPAMKRIFKISCVVINPDFWFVCLFVLKDASTDV